MFNRTSNKAMDALAHVIALAIAKAHPGLAADDVKVVNIDLKGDEPLGQAPFDPVMEEKAGDMDFAALEKAFLQSEEVPDGLSVKDAILDALKKKAAKASDELEERLNYTAPIPGFDDEEEDETPASPVDPPEAYMIPRSKAQKVMDLCCGEGIIEGKGVVHHYASVPSCDALAKIVGWDLVENGAFYTSTKMPSGKTLQTVFVVVG